MKQATFFDFIDVTLYEKERYKVRDIDYYILNSKGEYEKYHVTEALMWRDLKEYANKGMLWI